MIRAVFGHCGWMHAPQYRALGRVILYRRQEASMSQPEVSLRTPTLVDNPPNPRRTVEALRELGYDSYASILDLIDNSIDAEAKHIKITIRQEKEDIILSIEDDGVGMDEDTLSE